MDESLIKVERALGTGWRSKLARSLGIRPQAIQQWKRVPAERVLSVEQASGISRHELRPDIYGDRAMREQG